MSRKKILIINPDILFPKVMAFQDRVIELTKFLQKEHDVDIICLYRNEKEKTINQSMLDEICNQFFFIKKPNSTNLKRKICGLISYLLDRIFLIPKEVIYPNWPPVKKKILKIINQNHYDIIQIETWWQCSIFKKVKSKVFKVIDTHDVLFEKRNLELIFKRKGKLRKRDIKYLRNYTRLEFRNTNFADLIISISCHDKKIFHRYFPNKQHIVIPTGQDLIHFINHPIRNTEKTILFYGSMDGEQNIIAFWRLYNHIYTDIKKEIPSVKLIVLGANPPLLIRNLNNRDSILVTGYVEDVREYIAKSSLMILPLETSGGFRSRIVEVMAMGIPIIGTHNALDGIGLINKKNCIIEDENESIASIAVDLLSNQHKLKKLGQSSKKFANENFSLEKTYGKLSKYYEKNIENI